MIYKNGIRLGIVGGGQLGRMLIQSAVDLNINCIVLDPDENAPCKNIASEFYQGSLTDFETVLNFGKNADIITIEIENVNTDALSELKKMGKYVHPDPEIIRLIQDKGLQKQFYNKNLIPTADFKLIDNKEEIYNHLNFLPAFQKLRKEGYDGRGVKKISGKEEINSAFNKPSILEKLVDFEKEISVIVARRKNGETAAFPPVELEFNPEANLVEFLFMPSSIGVDIAEKAENIAVKLINSLNMVGILAVEMFVTKTGAVLVNEIAPRPHNSGHHTIEANYTSQYEQHLRAIMDLPLGSPKGKSAAVMVNLLGEEGFSGKAVYKGIEQILKLPGAHIHLYGKMMTKPFRKMGHVTIIDENIDIAKEKAIFVKNNLKVTA
jgi:5-(carboxyamino)imidazole ribonucleotide synthase